jgi:hypothetical protein
LLGAFCFWNCEQLARVAFESGSKLARIETAAFQKCGVLASFCLPSSVEFVGQCCFQKCDSLAAFAFEAPSHLLELLDLPPNSVAAVPGSVTKLRFLVAVKQRTRPVVRFGPDSRLTSLGNRRVGGSGRKLCFLHLSSRTIKVMRAQLEFDASSLAPDARLRQNADGAT